MLEIFSRLAERIRAARRTSEPLTRPSDPRVRPVVRTVAGVNITPDTAITVPAVWACLRYLSQTVAMLPWRVMQETPSGGVLSPTHRVDWLIRKRPAPEWSSFQWRETLTHWALRWGNGYAEIERDAAGRPLWLHPIHPERVEVSRDRVTGQLVYQINNGTAGIAYLGMMDVFHVRGFGEGPVGVNVMDYAAQSIGWARAAQLFGAAFFGNGLNVSGVIQMKKAMSPEALDILMAEMEKLYKGPGKANKVVPLDADMEFKSVQTDPEKSQFIETNQHLVEEVCRWFGVPPHKVQHLLRATFSNIEHQSIEVVTDSVMPWVKRFEEEADFKLFGFENRNSYYTNMDEKALMRGDAQSRSAFYKTMREIGAYSVNDILRREGENTIGPEGDIRVMQAQYVPLDRIGAEPAPATPVLPAPAQTQTTEPPAP